MPKPQKTKKPGPVAARRFISPEPTGAVTDRQAGKSKLRDLTGRSTKRFAPLPDKRPVRAPRRPNAARFEAGRPKGKKK